MSEPCVYCGELVLDGERDSWLLNATAHLECSARAILGSVAHQEGRCSCFVEGSAEEDPPGMTKREAARAALGLAKRRWATRSC